MDVEVTNPWTGQVEYRYPYQDQAAVERALEASRSAFPGWSSLLLEQRAITLEKVAGLLEADKERIAAEEVLATS